MNNPILDIRIGTLVQGNNNPAEYIRQILPYGFESFQITFWQRIGDMDLAKMAEDIHKVIGDRDVKIGALGMYGNPLMNGEIDAETRKGWEMLIDHAHLFGTNIVAGFTGRLTDQPLPDSLPRFREVFGNLGERAGAKGVKIAFENCSMEGTWERGDWNIAHNPAAWELMFEALPMENLGLEWEPCHQMVSLIDPMPQIREWAHKMFHIHGKCCTVKWDIVKKYGVHGKEKFAFHRTPGFGDCNWTDVISDLRMAGFKGSIDIEGWHDPVYKDELEMSGQVRSLHYLKACRGGEFVPNPSGL